MAPFPSEEHLQQDVGGEGEGSHWTLLCVSDFNRRNNPQAQGVWEKEGSQYQLGLVILGGLQLPVFSPVPVSRKLLGPMLPSKC